MHCSSYPFLPTWLLQGGHTYIFILEIYIYIFICLGTLPIAYVSLKKCGGRLWRLEAQLSVPEPILQPCIFQPVVFVTRTTFSIFKGCQKYLVWVYKHLRYLSNAKQNLMFFILSFDYNYKKLPKSPCPLCLLTGMSYIMHWRLCNCIKQYGTVQCCIVTILI